MFRKISKSILAGNIQLQQRLDFMIKPTEKDGGGKMQTKATLQNITIVLNKPKYSGNIGSVARCAKNMGIGRLSVVDHLAPDREEMGKMSTHLAAEVVDRIQYFDRLEEALAPFHYVIGMTARKGAARGIMLSPREAAAHLIDISQHNEIALLFGPEDTGLTNNDLRFCHAVVTIPTSSFKSINLSHAVMILCYEIFVAQMETGEKFTPRLATSAELEGMYSQIRGFLMKIGFLNPQNPEGWMMQLRRFLARTKLRSREVKIIRGICRQMEWYLGKGKTS
jgi:tRNA/rRNA methyltransferase